MFSNKKQQQKKEAFGLGSIKTHTTEPHSTFPLQENAPNHQNESKLKFGPNLRQCPIVYITILTTFWIFPNMP